MKYTNLTLLSCVIAWPLLSAFAAEPAPSVLPLGRSNYFVGERIPLGTLEGKVEILDDANRVVAIGKGGSFTLDTGALAPGNFQIKVNETLSARFSLTSTVRRSPGTVSDSAYSSFLGYPQAAGEKWKKANQALEQAKQALAQAEAQLAQAADPQAKEVAQAAVTKAAEPVAKLTAELPSLQPLSLGEKVHKDLTQSGIGAFTLVGRMDFEHTLPEDLLGTSQAMVYVNPYDRTSSFFGARVYEPEMTGMAERMMHLAQTSLRHPNFGGFVYHWDPCGFGRSGRYYYWGVDRHVKPGFVEFMRKSTEVMEAQFQERTGMKAPQTDESRWGSIVYSSGIKRPDLGPAFDLPTQKWIEGISKNAPPLAQAELDDLEKRLDAWTRYLMSVLPEASATFQKHLRSLEPSLKNTASHDNEFLPRDGNWPPTAYQPLDFRWVEAWSDQHDGGPDYIYQWLFHAGLADTDNPARQPIWVASVLSGAHGNFEFPGRFTRVAGQILAYNGRGLGLSVEGFSNLFGGMNQETLWGNIAGQSTQFDFEMGRDFIWRFAPLQEQSVPVRKVGILISEGQFALQQPGLGMGGSPHFEIFVHLARLGYTPRFVTEQTVEAGALTGFDSVVILNHFAKLPEPTRGKLSEFIQKGGAVWVSRNSTLVLEGAKTLELELPFMWAGRVYNLTAANFVGTERSPQRMETHLLKYGPILRAAFGEKSRSLLLPEGDEKSLVSTFSLGGGPDADYVVATNDTIYVKSGSWARQNVKLLPNAEAGAGKYTALYELTAEQSLGALAPFTAEFQDTTTRVFGLFTRPVTAVALAATQDVQAGKKIQLSVNFLDAEKKILQAAIPFHLVFLDPAGKEFGSYDRSTGIDGKFAMEIPLGVNSPAGQWKLQVRSCLDGKTVTLPIQVQAGKAIELAPLMDAVVVRNRVAITGLWQSKATVQAPIFEGPMKAQRLAAAQAAKQALAPLGVNVDIRMHPEISPYVIGWKLTPEQIQQNQRVESGKTIGRRFLDTGLYVGNYFSRITSYSSPLPLLLFNVVGESADGLTANLNSAGFLWPSVSELFPGKGRAVVQAMPSAFRLGVSSVVVQATDGEGLVRAAQALAKLPEDWISPSTAQARLELQRQMSIDRTAADAAGSGLAATFASGALSDKGAEAGNSPQALRLPAKTEAGVNLLPPAREEVYVEKSAAPAAPAALSVPGRFAIKDGGFLAQYRPEGEWVKTSEQFKNGDLRFSEGNQARIHVATAGTYRISAQGIFRFSDRRPATQQSWVSFIDEYMERVKPKREPMFFEVWLDGKAIGKLETVKAETGDVEISFTMGGGLNQPEERVTEVSGQVELPAGDHELMLVHENIVDGKLVSIGIEAVAK